LARSGLLLATHIIIEEGRGARPKPGESCQMSRRPSLLQSLLDDSSSDDEDELILSAAEIVQSHSQCAPKHGGSVPGHAVLYRDREGGHLRMYQDYLADDPTYGPTLFRRRFVCI